MSRLCLLCDAAWSAKPDFGVWKVESRTGQVHYAARDADATLCNVLVVVWRDMQPYIKTSWPDSDMVVPPDKRDFSVMGEVMLCICKVGNCACTARTHNLIRGLCDFCEGEPGQHVKPTEEQLLLIQKYTHGVDI